MSTTVINLTEAIELLSYALECVAQTEPCDLTDITVSHLAGKARERTDRKEKV